MASMVRSGGVLDSQFVAILCGIATNIVGCEVAVATANDRAKEGAAATADYGARPAPHRKADHESASCAEWAARAAEYRCPNTDG